MRKIPFRGGATAAKPEILIHLAPAATTTTTTAAAPPPKCEVQRCPLWPYSNSNDFKTNTALVLVFLFCTLIFALACSATIRYLVRLHCTRREQELRKANLGGAVREIEVPALIYSEEMKLAAAECAICLSEFAVGERIRVLEKCCHGFHVDCVERWLDSHSSCPTCRAIIAR